MMLNLPDTMRYLCFGQAFIVIIFTAVIVARYSFKLAVLKRSGERSGRALPWHIILIGISYIGLTFFAIITLREHIGEGWTWRIPFALFLFACGNGAFIFMLVHLSAQRVILAAVVDKMADKMVSEIIKTRESVDVIASTTEATHEVVKEVKEKLENGHS